MSLNWLKKPLVIGVIIPFLSTFMGVYLATYVDRFERRKDRNQSVVNILKIAVTDCEIVHKSIQARKVELLSRAFDTRAAVFNPHDYKPLPNASVTGAAIQGNIELLADLSEDIFSEYVLNQKKLVGAYMEVQATVTQAWQPAQYLQRVAGGLNAENLANDINLAKEDLHRAKREFVSAMEKFEPLQKRECELLMQGLAYMED